MVKVKDNNGMDLTEEKIFRRGGKKPQKNYIKKKILTTQINQDGVRITTNKAMEVMEFQLSYFKS